MKKMNFIFSVLAFMTVSISSAFAGPGSSDGNGGGNVVICFTDPAIPVAIRDRNSPYYGDLLDQYLEGDKVSSIEVFDLYEARLPRGINARRPEIGEIRPDESAKEYIDRVAKRFDDSVPRISQIIRDGMKEFTDDNILLEPHGLQKIDDMASVGLIDTKHCVLATAAQQYKAESALYLHIDQRIFSHPKMSEMNRAVLLLHEVFYRLYRKQGASDSRTTRKLLGAVITQNNGTTLESFLSLLQSLGIVHGSTGSDVLREILTTEFQKVTNQALNLGTDKKVWDALLARVDEVFKDLRCLLDNDNDRGPPFVSLSKFFNSSDGTYDMWTVFRYRAILRELYWNVPRLANDGFYVGRLLTTYSMRAYSPQFEYIYLTSAMTREQQQAVTSVLFEMMTHFHRNADAVKAALTQTYQNFRPRILAVKGFSDELMIEYDKAINAEIDKISTFYRNYPWKDKKDWDTTPKMDLRWTEPYNYKLPELPKDYVLPPL